MLTEHKKVCLSINDAQSVKLEKRTTEFKNCFKQIRLPFKIYAESYGFLFKNISRSRSL